MATFNEFGYADLYTEYMKLHPNVKIVSDKADTSDNARAAVQNSIATDTVTDDIVAADGDWMPELIASSDFFADLGSDAVKDRWPTWKTAMATDGDGKLIGYGTDSGPEAICYRKDLFEKAGLPSDRESVAKLLERRLGQLLQGRPAVHGRQHRCRVVRLDRRTVAGHDQPARGPVRGPEDR